MHWAVNQHARHAYHWFSWSARIDLVCERTKNLVACCSLIVLESCSYRNCNRPITWQHEIRWHRSTVAFQLIGTVRVLYAEQGLWNGTVSVRPSFCPYIGPLQPTSCCRLSPGADVSRTLQQRHAVGECGQCRVVSVRKSRRQSLSSHVHCDTQAGRRDGPTWRTAASCCLNQPILGITSCCASPIAPYPGN